MLILYGDGIFGPDLATALIARGDTVLARAPEGLRFVLGDGAGGCAALQVDRWIRHDPDPAALGERAAYPRLPEGLDASHARPAEPMWEHEASRLSWGVSSRPMTASERRVASVRALRESPGEAVLFGSLAGIVGAILLLSRPPRWGIGMARIAARLALLVGLLALAVVPGLLFAWLAAFGAPALVPLAGLASGLGPAMPIAASMRSRWRLGVVTAAGAALAVGVIAV